MSRALKGNMESSCKIVLQESSFGHLLTGSRTFLEFLGSTHHKHATSITPRVPEFQYAPEVRISVPTKRTEWVP